MDTENKGLAIILHSCSYDRLLHGLSLALAAAAMGRQTRIFFTYWALEYLKKGEGLPFKLDEEAKGYRKIIEKNIRDGHIQKIPELFQQAKALKVKFYACTNSMGMLNIARDELDACVDKSMGLTTFLAEAANDQMLFV